jgi:dihydrodipicolinate synthase/N-acetylneuraminate lyase
VAPVLHLPLDGTGAILWRVLGRLAGRMVGSGADGIVVLGLATESWVLDEAERSKATQVVVEAVGGRVPVIAGVDGDLEEATAQAEKRLADGAEALMVRPPQADGVVSHFRTLARRIDSPILIQDAPRGTGVTVEISDLLELGAGEQRLRTVKVEHPAGGPRVSALVHAGMRVVAGWGGLHYTEQLRRGAIGCMPGCDLGPAFARIHMLATSGQQEAAEELYRTVLPLLAYEAQSLELLIQGAKLALVELGIFPTPILRDASRDLDDDQVRTFTELFRLMRARQVPGW